MVYAFAWQRNHNVFSHYLCIEKNGFQIRLGREKTKKNHHNNNKRHEKKVKMRNLFSLHINKKKEK